MRPILPDAIPLALCALFALSACSTKAPASADAQTSQPTQASVSNPGADTSRQAFASGLLDQAARCLCELRRDAPQKSLDTAIEGARALIILPGIYQAGFLYSLHGGDGVLVARRADGGWGSPVFVGMGGAGYGLQVGLEKSRLVLAVMDEGMLERILNNSFHFDAAAKYDVVGVREESSRGSLTTDRPVMAFSDGVGLMAGVAIRGGLLQVNQGLTLAYYGQAAGNVQEIMRSANAPSLEVFTLWNTLVVELAGPEIIRQRRQ